MVGLRICQGGDHLREAAAELADLTVAWKRI
jgi:hypothetical protein